MPMYAAAVSDFYDKTNVTMVIWAENEVKAVVAAAVRKNTKVKSIEEKILDTYLTVTQLQKYFAGYWNIGVADPFEYMDMT
jgi:hypothetical protein